MSIDRRRVTRALAAAFAATVVGVPARAADPIKIGFSMPLTGGLSGGGKSVILAFELWKEDVNAKGGLIGRPVELVSYDHHSHHAPAMPIVMQRNLVFMALFGTGVSDTFNYDKYFQILPNGKETRLAPSLGFLETAMSMEPKPQTIALVAADAEYAQTVIAGARESVKRLGLRVVYDRSYPPTTVDYTPIVRAIQATNPDVVFVASYPPDSVGIVRAVNEIGFKPKMFGGGMIGLAFSPIKQQLGPLLNGIVAYDVYQPEPTMEFPGIKDFLKRYQARAPAAGVDPLGYYLPPYSYAEMQILAQAVDAVGSLDQAKIAAYIHATKFSTVVGDVKFADNGEWEKSRVLFVQYQNIVGNDIEQFRRPGKVVILYPPEYRSGKFIYPYSEIKR